MKRLIITACLIALFCISTYSQEQPRAILIDEFEKIHCNDFLARLDFIIVELQKKPTSIGYVLINGAKSNTRQNLIYENWIKGHIKFRGFDKTHLKIIRRELKEKMNFQIWIVPKGAEKPKFSEVKWNFKISPKTKPYIFTMTDWQDGLCPGSAYLSLNSFSEYLNNNLNAKGNFVIRTYSRKLFNKEKKEIQNILVNRYKIQNQRLRFFYVFDNKNRNSKYYNPRVEVWLVPKNKRN